MAQRVFFDICIGDKADYQTEQDQYQRCISFFKEAGGQLGFGEERTVESLDEEEKKNWPDVLSPSGAFMCWSH